jgi:methyl-accepting chemotaxis protein
MTSKLLLGFGVVLLVFAAAVFVTWMDLSEVREKSEFLRSKVVPALQIKSGIESAATAVFMTTRETRYTGTEETMKDDDVKVAGLNKALADMEALGAANPDLKSPKMVRENVLPIHKNFVDSLNRLHEALRKKNASWLELVKAGNVMTSTTQEALESYRNAAVAENDHMSKAQRVEQIYSVGRMYGDALDLRRQITAASGANDPQAFLKAKDTCATLEQWAQNVHDGSSDEERRRMIQKVSAALKSYVTELDLMATAIQAQNDAINSLVLLSGTYNDKVAEVSAFAQTTVKTVSDENIDLVHSTVTLLFSSGAISLLLGLLIAIFLSRAISKPLRTIVELAKRCQEGDLTIQRTDFGYEGKDELGNLVGALSDMVEGQESAMRNVVTVAEELGDVAEKLTSIAGETNDSMKKVKNDFEHVYELSEGNGAALEESNAGVEEMSAGADTVAQSSTDTASSIARTTDAAIKATEMVNTVIDGMKNVDKNAKDSEDKTRQLVDSIENVSGFVTVITGIADQTNLLALNAAIEAARAGDVGRGFAVVAEEVRKLAEESAKAAQNVNRIIVDLQTQAQESIKATTQAGHALSETLVQATAAQNELSQAMNEIRKANDSIQNIAAVAEEQAASSKEVAHAIDKATKSTVEINETMNEMQKQTEATAKTAQVISGQAEIMTGHAQSLGEALSRFRLRETQNQRNAAPKKPALPGKR